MRRFLSGLGNLTFILEEPQSEHGLSGHNWQPAAIGNQNFHSEIVGWTCPATRAPAYAQGGNSR